MTYCCDDNCECERLSDMKFGERMPVHIDCTEWMESIGSRTLLSADWKVTYATCEDTPLVITGQDVNKGSNVVTAHLSEGGAGVLYRIQVEIETCEGHKGIKCIEQFVRNC